MKQSKPSLDDLKIERRDTGQRRTWLWPLVLVILLIVVGGGVLAWLRPRALEMEVVIAREAGTGVGNERTVLNASGYVTARRAATVSSKVTGKVVEVFVEEGMKVQAGQVLARLDDTNVVASLRLAEAQRASAKAGLTETRVRIKEAQQELDRQSRLVKEKIATQADFDHAEAALLALKARLEQQEADITVAERQVASWEQQLDDTVIRAPFAGIVTLKNAQPGEMISPISAGGGFTRTGICTIVDMESLEIEIDVNESYINRVEPGQAVEAALDAYPDWKIPCKVIAIIPTADRQKSTVRVRVGFEKLDPKILPEMSVKVGFREIAGGGPAANRPVVIPAAALREADGKNVVLVVQAGRAERRAVTVTETRAGESVIGAGLSAGERIALNWPPELRDGASVREKNP
jgi:RND family efflux transporter MFP subunit